MTDRIPAVIYAAKSTEDKHGSIPTQLEDCRRQAEDRDLVRDFQDEGFSGYSGNRGPGLEQARKVAAQTAAERGTCELWAQHSDRFARGPGDKPGAAEHLVEILMWANRHNVVLRTVQDDFFADPRTNVQMAAMMGQRNTEDSARKSRSVSDGQRRRRESGLPVGRMGTGYKVEQVTVANEIVPVRVLDPDWVPVVERIFDLVEAGPTFGSVARLFNGEGLRTRPTKKAPNGNPWTARAVRRIVHNTAYKGEKNYPKIIEPERFDTIHAGLKRLDPAAVAKRKGGRKPVDDSYFLRGLGFCLRCGAPLYTRLQAVGRVYICAHVRQRTGLCDAPPIPAELFENQVLRHLDTFIGSVEDWLQEQVEARSGQRREREKALVTQQTRFTDLDRQRERHLADYRRLIGEGKTGKAEIALEEVERIDRERQEQEQTIEQLEAVVSEWSGPPDVDAALDYYTELVDSVRGLVREAKGPQELHDKLTTVVAGLWADVEEDRERLLVEFELLNFKEERHPLFGTQRPTLPPRMLDDRRLPDDPWREREIARVVAEAGERVWPSKPGPSIGGDPAAGSSDNPERRS